MFKLAPEIEPFIDLVQIRAVGAFGTGLLVGPGLVLTALHTVCDPNDGWKVRKDAGVYLWRELREGKELHRDVHIVWPDFDAPLMDPVDIAVLQLVDPDQPKPLAKQRFGELPSKATEGSARGFPRATAGSELPGNRIEHDQPGTIHYTSVTRHALTFYPKNHHEMGRCESWAGLSGGPLIAGGLILGVMREVPDGWEGGAIEAEPLAPPLRSSSDLRALLGVTLPLGNSTLGSPANIAVGFEAAAASNHIFGATKGKPFYGRSPDIEQLDKSLICHDRGLVLLRGEAGVGKSHLLANWSDRIARNRAYIVLRHAFSVRNPTAGTRDQMVRNLIRQFTNAVGPQAVGPELFGGEAWLADRLAIVLTTDQTDDQRVVVVLDGLDEAAEPIDPLVMALGRGVFVVVSFRAERDEEPDHSREPRVPRLWRAQAREASTPIVDWRLEPLEVSAISEWLACATGRSFTPTDSMVSRAMKASEGIPLFAEYLIPDAIEALTSGARDPFPLTFRDYAFRQLEYLGDQLVLQRTSCWSWSEVLELFAILSVAKEPLTTETIRNLIGQHLLDGLDPRAERWLSHHVGAGSAISLAHPRLASVFAEVLPRFDPDLVVSIKERLIDSCVLAWCSEKSREPLRDYALAWLPAHLVESGRKEDAASLLGNGAFLLARLIAKPTTATVRLTASETFTLSHGISGMHALAEWRRFWAEAESALILAIDRSKPLGSAAAVIFTQLAHDRFGADAPTFKAISSYFTSISSRMRLAQPIGFLHPNLLRSLDDAHEYDINGLLVLTDKIVSWGLDGALRFWSFTGELCTGGDLGAHKHGIDCVLKLRDRLVSCGSATVRFWSLDGEPLPGGDSSADACREYSLRIFALPDGLVSWDSARAIRVWDLDGQSRSLGDTKAHRGGLSGILQLADKFVSYGEGEIRFWSRAWEPRSGGDSRAHGGWVNGMLALPDRLVSWSCPEGAIRFWSLEGQPLAGGDARAHELGVEGILVVANHLVSWGRDGAIRFWSQDGKPLSGGHAQAHRGWVEGVLMLADRLVSWGWDGAIRFWNLDGKPLSGGALQAHQSAVQGVTALENELVSWGQEGAFRFWSLDGQPRAGGEPRAHEGGVRGVKKLPDRLVSWGADQAIRFWVRTTDSQPIGHVIRHSHGIGGILGTPNGLVSWGTSHCGEIYFWDSDGEPRPGGDPRAHTGAVSGMLLLADSLVSWSLDGAIRFWSLTGAPKPGGEVNAHDDGVWGMLMLPDRLLSWGEGGEIRVWSHDGEPLSGARQGLFEDSTRGALALPDTLVTWGEDGEPASDSGATRASHCRAAIRSHMQTGSAVCWR